MLRQQPAGKAGSFLAAGYCMAPTILPGDDLVVEDCPGRPRRGWIVVFPWRDRLLAHRIVRVHGDRFWSRGDAVLDEEGPIATSAIVGRVTGRIRDGKR
ncbi:MAG: S24/S26 family peptidase, partial [Acidobacteriota bacterium]